MPACPNGYAQMVLLHRMVVAMFRYVSLYFAMFRYARVFAPNKIVGGEVAPLRHGLLFIIPLSDADVSKRDA